MKRQLRDIQVHQDAVNYIQNQPHQATAPFIAQVLKSYSDRMTCDIKTVDGQLLNNIPILTRGGLVGGTPYGEVCLPVIDDYVIVIHASYGVRHKLIIGTFLPYLANEMTADVTNSGGKQFTKKLFVEGTPLAYRRVFPSGTSIEVTDDGDVIVEHPNGAYIKIDDDITVEDQNGNAVIMGATSVTINGNLEVLQ